MEGSKGTVWRNILAASTIDLNVDGEGKGTRHGKEVAIRITSASKSFGKKTVLDHLNMTVESGSIYGLLGSSGCGKTTLLSCIVGLRSIDSGMIRLFGKSPGAKDSGVPGKLVGYMPQEVALNGEFTIKEICHYFGKIYGMTAQKIKDRTNELVGLLQLDGCTGFLKTMSGGQRRRISFIASLIHQPQILILDEPTVGVDPLLRQAIWKYLDHLVNENKTTVIITTHYVEETHSANKIGLMRNGRLILEDSPQDLLNHFQTSLLEDVVLKFCVKDEHKEVAKSQKSKTTGQSSRSLRLFSQNHTRLDEEAPEANRVPEDEVFSPPNQPGKECIDSTTKPIHDLSTRSIDRLTAMIVKNFFVLFRNIGYLLFLFILPALQIVMICVCLSSDPKALQFGYVNHEVPETFQCIFEPGVCIVGNLSCGYLEALKSETINLQAYESEARALNAVQIGELVGYLVIPANFTNALFDRMSGNDKAMLNDTIENSQVHFHMDMSNSQVSLILQRLFLTKFREFVRNLVAACGDNPDGRDIPIVFDTPVYGEDGGKITNFVTPGVTTAFLSFLSSLTCGLAFIGEKKDGMVHRNFVAGVKKIEFMLAHLLTQVSVLIVQMTIAFLAMFLLFNIPHIGSILLAFLLVFLNGVAGMSLGFLAATYCEEEKTAMLIAIGTILPCFLLSGAIFPSEALPTSLQYLGYLLPGTLPGDGLRAILLKGWGMNHQVVWLGFVSAIVWIIIYWSLTAIHHFLWK